MSDGGHLTAAQVASYRAATAIHLAHITLKGMTIVVIEHMLMQADQWRSPELSRPIWRGESTNPNGEQCTTNLRSSLVN